MYRRTGDDGGVGIAYIARRYILAPTGATFIFITLFEPGADRAATAEQPRL